MDLTQDEFKHLEELSKIRVSKEKTKEYMEKLSSIFQFIHTLSTINTDGVEPISQVTKIVNSLRKDEIRPSLSQIDVLKNSKHVYKGYFKIPKIIE